MSADANNPYAGLTWGEAIASYMNDGGMDLAPQATFDGFELSAYHVRPDDVQSVTIAATVTAVAPGAGTPGVDELDPSVIANAFGDVVRLLGKASLDALDRMDARR